MHDFERVRDTYMDKDWTRYARCRDHDPELWFPTKDDSTGSMSRARAICGDCPVRVPCLTEGMNNEFGVWAGWSPDQRDRLARRLEVLPAVSRTAVLQRAAMRGPGILNGRKH